MQFEQSFWGAYCHLLRLHALTAAQARQSFINTSIVSSLKALLNDAASSDMVLKATEENEEVSFNVHKAIVGSQSAVLKAMFEVTIILLKFGITSFGCVVCIQSLIFLMLAQTPLCHDSQTWRKAMKFS